MDVEQGADRGACYLFDRMPLLGDVRRRRGRSVLSPESAKETDETTGMISMALRISGCLILETEAKMGISCLYL